MSDRQLTIVPCFVCARPLFQAAPDSPMQPSKGVACLTYGNYGSTVFDPLVLAGHKERLMFLVCDKCIAERADSVRLAVTPRARPETTYTKWPA